MAHTCHIFQLQNTYYNNLIEKKKKLIYLQEVVFYSEEMFAENINKSLILFSVLDGTNVMSGKKNGLQRKYSTYDNMLHILTVII